jgi:formylglycine-generating enzyme required for sulfatase activity
MTPEMNAIPGGTVRLRDDRHKRQWEVELLPFKMGVYPVTQALYESVTGTNPSHFVGAKRPVENVSWYDAIAFCNALSVSQALTPVYVIGESLDDVSIEDDANGFRLPSDAERQYAGLGGQTKPLYGPIDEIAWYAGNADNQTHNVGQKLPNHFGLYDMVGNVWEWCFDLYDPDEYGTYRIFRGGGWNDPERHCLLTNRRRSHPTFAIEDIGFRVAQNAQKA